MLDVLSKWGHKPLDPYKPSVLYVGNVQTVQSQNAVSDQGLGQSLLAKCSIQNFGKNEEEKTLKRK